MQANHRQACDFLLASDVEGSGEGDGEGDGDGDGDGEGDGEGDAGAAGTSARGPYGGVDGVMRLSGASMHVYCTRCSLYLSSSQVFNVTVCGCLQLMQ
jgi:hypothetical protein